MGIDCREIYDVKNGRGAGIARYVFNLASAMLKMRRDDLEFVLFFDKKIGKETLEELRRSGGFEPIFVGRGIPFVSGHVYFPLIVRNAGVDKMIFPANVMPLLCFRKALVVVHDLAIYPHPEWFPPQWFSTKILVPWSLIKAWRIVAVSKNTKKDVLEIFPNVDADKVDVVYPAPSLFGNRLSHGASAHNVGVKDRYIVFVGTLEPRKNVVNLLRAFVEYSRESGDDLKLKLISAWGWKTEEIRRALRAANDAAPERIEYLGALNDEEKVEIVSGARALLLPSFYEGFGLPIVEAMKLGVPVVAGDNSSMSEISDRAALLVDPMNVEEIKSAIKKILTDQNFAKELSARGRVVAEKFDWDKTAREFMDVLNSN
jgi:glycosyltransferase involved in cell wall biosynthesis